MDRGKERWGSLRKGNHFENPGIDRRIILRWILRSGMGAWNELLWLRTGTGGRLL
jgi:hypothetical protein